MQPDYKILVAGRFKMRTHSIVQRSLKVTFRLEGQTSACVLGVTSCDFAACWCYQLRFAYCQAYVAALPGSVCVFAKSIRQFTSSLDLKPELGKAILYWGYRWANLSFIFAGGAICTISWCFGSSAQAGGKRKGGRPRGDTSDVTGDEASSFLPEGSSVPSCTDSEFELGDAGG
ncbi:hypothetical protein FF38_14054 [Lucilia cuprina]|uniref:Uncharacterized protein n=1 Tax=Lucilia cuprina TaxID=7375 RepID=A0A0L0BYR9_LUCCU|nr:hypothetical protein FF38_14054 [Lucilia cuprina]